MKTKQENNSTQRTDKTKTTKADNKRELEIKKLKSRIAELEFQIEEWQKEWIKRSL